MIKTFQNISIPKLPVLTTEEGMKQIKNNLDKIIEWRNILDLIPKFYLDKKMKKDWSSRYICSKSRIIKKKLFQFLKIKISINS